MKTSDEVRKLLQQKAEQLGSQRLLAQAIGVSDQFISDILRGKREPSGKAVEYLGLRRKVVYEVTA